MNLANLPQEEKDKINVDLAASGVAYKERLNMPVVASEVERQQLAHLWMYFNKGLVFYSEKNKKLLHGNSAPYLKELSNLIYIKTQVLTNNLLIYISSIIDITHWTTITRSILTISLPTINRLKLSKPTPSIEKTIFT